ncbi:MAG: hypothetical protein ACYTEQ_27690, partial [Planctomycetota bacterium]
AKLLRSRRRFTQGLVQGFLCACTSTHLLYRICPAKASVTVFSRHHIRFEDLEKRLLAAAECTGMFRSSACV